MKDMFVASLSALLALGGCQHAAQDKTAQPSTDQSYGAQPSLPKPHPTLIPTVNIAPAISWPKGMRPTPAPGFAVNSFASGLDHPRWLHVLPNGDILVAETNAPAKPAGGSSLREIIMNAVMKRAGAKAPSANRITLLRDADGDGIAEIKSIFLENLNSPFGMALIGGTLYVAKTDAIVAFAYETGALRLTGPGTILTSLPAGPINHHWTKDIIASPDGTKLYATVGSNSNVGENGIANEQNRAAVLEVDIATKTSRIFASGLRNANGLSWQPQKWCLVGCCK